MAYYNMKIDADDDLIYSPTKPKSSSSSAPSTAVFNRSLTMHSSKPSEFTKKSPLNSSSSSFERNGSMKKLNSSLDSLKGKVKKLCSIFEKPPLNSSNLQSMPSSLSKLSISASAPRVSVFPPGTEDRVVIYFTSLRGIRKTFQDCSYVLMTFKGFRVKIDERDISMHNEYRTELSGFLRGKGEKTVTLPQVFIKGKYIGGADIIRQLHETGELPKMLKGVPIKTKFKACEECGDMRFVPCVNCNGSRKVFDEDEDQVRRCPDCNENGLVHCTICSVS